MTPLLLQSTYGRNVVVDTMQHYGIIYLISLIPFIFFILTLQNTLKAIAPQNRKIQPERAWLLLIPLFRYVWTFIVVIRISESIALEYSSRKLPYPPKPTYNIGLTYAAFACGIIIPEINIIAGLGALVSWVTYWGKVNEFKTQLNQTAKQ